MIGKGAISLQGAKNIAISVGKRLVDRGNLNGEKMSLELINDVLDHSMPKKLRPIVTTDTAFLNKSFKKYGISEQQAQTIHSTSIAITLAKPNMKSHFVYINKATLEQSNFLALSGHIAHEIFHCLSRGKTIKGKKELRELQQAFHKGYRPKAGEDPSKSLIDLQFLIRNSFKIDEFANPTPELGKLYKRLTTKDRSLARIRTTLRTVLDPRLKNGETRISRDKINPNSTVVRPTIKIMQDIINVFKEESNAYKVGGTVDKYALNLQEGGTTINNMISELLAKTVRVLESEMKLLKHNNG